MKGIDFIKRLSVGKAFKTFPKGHTAAIAALSFALLLFSAFSPSGESSASPEQHEQLLELSLNKTAIAETALAVGPKPVSSSKILPVATHASDALEAPVGGDAIRLVNAAVTTVTTPHSPQWHSETVKAGDSLSLLFQRAGLPDTSLFELVHSSAEAKKLTQVYPGQTFKFLIDNDGRLEALTYQKNRLRWVEFVRENGAFVAKSHALKPDVQTAYREATIINSLFLAGTDAGMEQSLIMELASIFGWDIDFALDIRTNDSFKVLYEELFLNGEKLRNGAILAAEFTNQGKTFKAVRYTDSNGRSNYYTPEGKSMRKAFLRTPVDFTRISSHFNLKRKHPILKKVRAHKGTDYAAPTGTPIKAAGDGRVTFAGTKGGYGRTVIIQHGQSYKTLYAHMHRYGKGIRSGKRVKQGQIIGYVGSSGLSTGPHLHYEFHHNGVVRNPVKVSLPKAQSIPKAELAQFKAQTQPIVAKLDAYGKGIQVAASRAAETSQN